MFKQNLKCILAVAMLSSIATFSYAEDAAPVYDADNYPPTFDGQTAEADVANTTEATPNLTTEQRLSRAEKQITHIQSKDLSGKVDSLLSEIQSLRGQVELLTHQLQQVQTQQKTMYSDLDKRITSGASSSKPTLASDDTALTDDEVAIPATTKLKTNPKLVTSTAITKTKPKLPTKAKSVTDATLADSADAVKAEVAPQPNVAEEQQIYQTAYDLIKAKKYNEAIAALQKMLQKYPSGQFAANAHYWLGELYGLLGKGDQSAKEFGTVVKGYPDSPKVSDAQLKLGLIYASQFKWPDAKSAFKRVINHYPGTASARLAAEQIKQIKEAGH